MKGGKGTLLLMEFICNFSPGTKLVSFGILLTDTTNIEVDTTDVC